MEQEPQTLVEAPKRPAVDSVEQRRPRSAAPVRTRDCVVCLGPHSDKTHAATLSVKEWFRADINRRSTPLGG